MVVKPSAVQLTNSIELMGQSKNDVVMFHWIGIIDAIFHPECLLGSLAFWTMAITTAVVANVLTMAVITTVLMAAQGSCPARRQCPQNTQLIRIGVVLIHESTSKSFNNVCYLVFGAAHKACL